MSDLVESNCPGRRPLTEVRGLDPRGTVIVCVVKVDRRNLHLERTELERELSIRGHVNTTDVSQYNPSLISLPGDGWNAYGIFIVDLAILRGVTKGEQGEVDCGGLSGAPEVGNTDKVSKGWIISVR
jgi:hypothetical protein